MLELAILGLLKERPMHGYEIRKSLREDVGVLSNLSFGSLYPALARLESAGAVASIEADLAARRGRRTETSVPLTGSLGGERAAAGARRTLSEAAAALGARSTRSRKVYEITTEGERLFDELLESVDSSSEDPRGFSLRLAFARHLSPQSRVRLLERRRNQLAERLQRSERSLERRAPTLDTYELSLAEHANETVASDLSWVERLLDRERTTVASLERPAKPAARARSGGGSHRNETPLPAKIGAGPAKGAPRAL